MNLIRLAEQIFIEELNFYFNPDQMTELGADYFEHINGFQAVYDRLKVKSIYRCDEITDESLTLRNSDLKGSVKSQRNHLPNYNEVFVFAVEVEAERPRKSDLAELTRKINRFNENQPTVVLFQCRENFTLTLAERMPYVKEQARQKVGKVSMLHKVAIDPKDRHQAQARILKGLSIQELDRRSPNATINEVNQLYYGWLAQLSINKLNKEFYADIVAWFNHAIKEIKIDGQKPESEKHKEFTIRLIARIIFVWFLKELKVVDSQLLIPRWDKSIDNDLIQSSNEGSDYYKYVLQNLFFNGLGTTTENRSGTAFDTYGQYFPDKETLDRLLRNVPYLNGGLFDPHPSDLVDFSNATPTLEVPDHLFLSETGLNTLLHKYKFTVTENTPTDVDVAVDPEMLGRIFENLLAEQRNDTQDSARKFAGAFYTPRPVVSYMSRNLLLRHLGVEVSQQNGKAIVEKILNHTKVIDPACGSGAFIMGMLEEMLNLLDQVDPEGKLWTAQLLKSRDNAFIEYASEFVEDDQVRYLKKLGILRNCLFGVDILSYAIEITKLRAWLSLIVDQHIDAQKPNFNLKPLPNLDFKFFRKNSLYRSFVVQKESINLNDYLENYSDQLTHLSTGHKSYFINHGTDKKEHWEEIEKKTLEILSKLAEDSIRTLEDQKKRKTDSLNKLRASNIIERDKLVKKEEKELEKLIPQLQALYQEEELVKGTDQTAGFLIEKVVFPSVFENGNQGFDLVIGNPPYVNTRQKSAMGIKERLVTEYNFNDDLYNYFTFRGLELLKPGGIISFITSDTFLTLQTKENMRLAFLGIENGVRISRNNEARLLEIINTPKAFHAMVDTAIFTVQRNQPVDTDLCEYIDLRFPTANQFGLSEEEFKSMTKSSDGDAVWEIILEQTFSALSRHQDWQPSHTCGSASVEINQANPFEHYRLPLDLYRRSLNHALFAPNSYNSVVYDKVVVDAMKLKEQWWKMIENAKKIEQNKGFIKSNHIDKLNAGSITLLGLITEGGQGLATGDNGKFVGVKAGTKEAKRVEQTRPKKLAEAIRKQPKIKTEFFPDCNTDDQCLEKFALMEEDAIRTLFDGIKNRFGARAFSKGYLYRIVQENEIREVNTLTDIDKKDGIDTPTEAYVPYDKGDRDGNRWYLQSPYYIIWNKDTVSWLYKNSGKKRGGMPVVRNPQFYFKAGFCWTDVHTFLIKTRYKSTTINDVKSMSLYLFTERTSTSCIVGILNSTLSALLIEEFINQTQTFQINDARQFPIIIPDEELLGAFNALFDRAKAIKEAQFSGEINKEQAEAELQAIDEENDRLVFRLYGLEGIALPHYLRRRKNSETLLTDGMPDELDDEEFTEEDDD